MSARTLPDAGSSESVDSWQFVATFIRRPQTASELVADGIRVLAVLSVIVAGIGWGPAQAGVFLLGLLGTLVPRALGVRAAFDAATGAIVLIATWSNIFDLYTRFLGWDKVVHFALTGVLAALCTVWAQRTGLLPSGPTSRTGLIMSTLAFGLAAGAVWEMLEWGGHRFIDAGIFVGYDDTIGDLAADGLGALLAGLALPVLTARPEVRRR